MPKLEISSAGSGAFEGMLSLMHTHPLYVIVPLVGLFLTALSQFYNHRREARTLKGALSELTARWTAGLDQVRDDLIIFDSSVIAHRVDEYDGQTRVEYEAARKVWSLWLAQRQKLQGRLIEAQAIGDQAEASVWWKFKLGRVKQAAASLTAGRVAVDASALQGGPYSAVADTAECCEVTGSELFEQMLSNSVRSKELCQRFKQGLETAQANVRQVESLVNGDGRSTGLPAFKGKLAALNLPLAPYQDRMSSVLATRDELGHNILRQPLANWAAPIRALSDQIKTLEQDVSTACSMHSLMLTTLGSIDDLQSRIDKLRSDPVPSSLSGVVVPGTWRLDEDGYQPDALIVQAKQCMAEFGLALEGGNFSRLKFHNISATEAIGRASSLVDKTLEEKAFTEQRLTTIDCFATDVDRAADRPVREECLAAYVAQTWGQARKVTEAFFALHSKRVGARSESQRLLAAVAEVGLEIKRQADITSAQCDQSYVELAQRATLLDTETKSGQADWDGLTSTIKNVRTGRVEGGLVSLLAVLKDELDAHNAAKISVNRLQQDLTELDANTADRWGGAEARRILQSVAPAVQEVIASADPSKQDWNQLSERVQKAYTLLSPALQLVAAEIAIDREQARRISSLGSEVLLCEKMSYTRSICGQVYGQGIYCPVLEPAKKLALARELHQQRQYAKMAAPLAEGRSALISAHLDAWWMCLQLLSGSNHPCSQQFAAEQGYCGWEYDAWMAQRTSESLAGKLYDLPQGPGNLHNQSEAATPPGDLPDIKDYAPGGLKC